MPSCFLLAFSVFLAAGLRCQIDIDNCAAVPIEEFTGKLMTSTNNSASPIEYPYHKATSGTLKQRLYRWYKQLKMQRTAAPHADLAYFTGQLHEPAMISYDFQHGFGGRTIQHLPTHYLSSTSAALGSVGIVMADTRAPQWLGQGWQRSSRRDSIVSYTAHANAGYAARHGYDFAFFLVECQANAPFPPCLLDDGHLRTKKYTSSRSGLPSLRYTSDVGLPNRTVLRQPTPLYSYGANEWRSAPWGKVLVVWNATFFYDWVVWVDSDGFLQKHDVDLGQLIAAMKPEHNILVYSDMPDRMFRANTGFMLIRSGSGARRLLHSWWESHSDWAAVHSFDQRGFDNFVTDYNIGKFDPELAEMVVIVEHIAMNQNYSRLYFPPPATASLPFFIQVPHCFQGDRHAQIHETAVELSKNFGFPTKAPVGTNSTKPGWVHSVSWDATAQAVHFNRSTRAPA